MAPKFPKIVVDIDLDGPNGNVFAVRGIVAKALRKAGHMDEADEFRAKVLLAENYDGVIELAKEYVDLQT